MVSDITLDTGGGVQPVSSMHRMTGREGDLVLVKGQLIPQLIAAPGAVERWHVIKCLHLAGLSTSDSTRRTCNSWASTCHLAASHSRSTRCYSPPGTARTCSSPPAPEPPHCEHFPPLRHRGRWVGLVDDDGAVRAAEDLVGGQTVVLWGGGHRSQAQGRSGDPTVVP